MRKTEEVKLKLNDDGQRQRAALWRASRIPLLHHGYHMRRVGCTREPAFRRDKGNRRKCKALPGYSEQSPEQGRESCSNKIILHVLSVMGRSVRKFRSLSARNTQQALTRCYILADLKAQTILPTPSVDLRKPPAFLCSLPTGRRIGRRGCDSRLICDELTKLTLGVQTPGLEVHGKRCISCRC